jgi:transcriptional regulator with XRE-family HTH domain
VIPVGRQLKEAREAKEMSVHNLAVLSGIDPFVIARIEQGRFMPDWSMLTRLADGLGCSPADILGPYPASLLPRSPRYVKAA